MLASTFWEVSFLDLIRGLPHDAGAVAVYLVLALFLGFIYLGSRGGGEADSSEESSHDAE